jgi:adenylosuccinate synthase
MKLVFALLVAFGLMGFVAPPAHAADPAPAPAPAKADEKKPKSVRGEVVKVEGNKVTIKAKDKEIVVVTDEKTQVMIEGTAGKLADLKAGQKVVVTPAEGTATKIAVPKAKEKKAAK